MFYDRSGKARRKPPTTRVLPRESVYAILLHENQLLFVEPVHTSWFELPGGAILKGESHEQALIREVFEETGITIVPPFTLLETRQSNFYADDLDLFFDASLNFYRVQFSGEPKELAVQDRAEIQRASWIPLSSLPSIPLRADHHDVILKTM